MTEDVPEPVNTGERFLPGSIYSAEVAYDHFARYRLAERYVEGKDAIDLGCGVGYGTHFLAKVARSIIGVDLSDEAVAYASGCYRAPNLRYEVGSVTDLPYEDRSFEAAVSFEVIEHLENPEDLVLQARRLLKDDGVFVVSTPDKQTYSNDRNSVNPHHLGEMYPLEFKELLERNFEHVQMYWQGALAGSMVTSDPEELPEDGQVSLESAQYSLPNPAFGRENPIMLYVIAVCTNGEAPETLHRPLLIIDRDRQVYEEQLDWRTIVVQLLGYHNYQNKALKHRLLATHRRLQEAHKMLQEERKRFREPNGHLQEESERLRETNQWLQEGKERLQPLNRRLQEESERLRETNQRLQEESRQLRQLRRETARMQSTFRWKIAYSINVAAIKVRSILGGG
jgi:SAM-dependent methyltransferase